MKQEYVKCHVPMGVEAWSSATASSTSAKFRELLTQALAEKREPQALPKEVDKIAIDLATEINALTARMDELRSQGLIADGVAPGRIAGMLVQAQLNRSAKANATAQQPQAQQKTGLWPDQLKLHDEFMGIAKQGGIAAVEAGTGTGKSRIIGACAHSLVTLRNEGHTFPTHNNQTAQARHPAFITDKVATWHETEQRLHTTEGQKPPVVIAAPTIANLLHLLREFKSLDLPGATYALLIGRQQFASAQAIAELLQEHPCPPVEAWLQAGMPCGQSSNTAGIGVNGLMDDLRTANVDFMTIGQYLAPSKKHHAVMRFVTPDEFKSYETVAFTKGFLMVASSPLTRSSHHAGEDFARLRTARAAQLKKLA